MDKDILHNIKCTAGILLGLLLVLFLYLTYIQVIEGDKLANHPLNRRMNILTDSLPRGRILDKNGEQLAYSVPNGHGSYQRMYPYGSELAHVVGYNSSKYGNAGLESTENGYLSGMYNIGHYLGAVSHLFASTNNDVIATIDAKLQHTAYQALGNRKGAVIVIEPRTGAVLAMVSKPSFDDSSIDKDWAAVSQGKDSPLLNRATQGLYPPGSSIKTMVAEAALHDKVISARETIINCQGALTIGNYELTEIGRHAHGPVDLEQALADSCNTAFGTLAMKIGRSGMEKTFERYGFKKSLDGDFAEAASRLPDFGHLGEGDLAQTGIGQAQLLVTPLHMAMLAACFANNGTIMKPRLVSAVKAPDGSLITEFKAEKWLNVTDPELAAKIAKMMVGVVEHGTGSAARISGVAVAGKTGTAENPLGASHAWFIGFAPAFDPQVAIAVIVENGGSGGGVAAPIARQILEQALN